MLGRLRRVTPAGAMISWSTSRAKGLGVLEALRRADIQGLRHSSGNAVEALGKLMEQRNRAKVSARPDLESLVLGGDMSPLCCIWMAFASVVYALMLLQTFDDRSCVKCLLLYTA